VLTLGVVVSAEAITFSFDNVGGFTFGSESSSEGPGTGISFFNLIPQDPPPGDQYGTIGWGNQSGPSFVTLVDPFTLDSPDPTAARSALRVETFNGTIDPGQTVTIAVLTHANRTIVDPTLVSVNIDNLLQLKDGATTVFTQSPTTTIQLTETVNAAPCDPDTHIPNTTPCSDFFLFELAQFAPAPFSHNGVDYLLTFALVPIGGAIFERVDCADPAGSPVADGACGRVRTAEASTNQILIQMTLTVVGTPPTHACPRTQGFWKNHPEAWPATATTLTLGSQLYTQAELITIFQTPPKGDASLILAHQLIATKLNILNGADPDPIAATVVQGDALLSAFAGKLPYGVHASTPTGQAMVGVASTLDQYNNGAFTPDCVGPR
jgi:hypothetical protein